MPTSIYNTDFQEEIFNLAKPGRKATFSRKFVYKQKPCPIKAFSAQVQHSLCQGRTLKVTDTASVVKRELVESELSVLENWLDFSQFGYNWDYKGWRNVRFDKKKGSETFYHLVHRIRAVHYTRKLTGKRAGLGPLQWAEYFVEIVCLNPLGSVSSSANFKGISDQDKQDIIDHVHCLPARLKTDGYPVDPHLRKICKSIIRQRLNN